MNRRNTDDEYTCISGHGMPVVDYCIIPHEHFHRVNDFKVTRARTLFDSTHSIGEVDPSKGLPGHSVLSWNMDLLRAVSVRKYSVLNIRLRYILIWAQLM